jgi:hypothetical protein
MMLAGFEVICSRLLFICSHFCDEIYLMVIIGDELEMIEMDCLMGLMVGRG